MAKADEMFINDLIEVATEDFEIDNRAKWQDGSQVKTKRILQSVNKYDLSEGFPILTLRDINFKAAVDEMLWIYSKLSNDTSQLNSNIWDSWKNERGLVEKAYGYQIAKSTMGHRSQMHYVLHEIKNNPASRRIQMNMFDAKDQFIKATESLIECAYSTHFSVKDGKLHMTLIQRSGDLLTAAGFGGWNTVQYAALQHAIAMECNLEVGVFTHFIQDLHLYNKHWDQAFKLVRRSFNNDLKAPTIKIKRKPFFELTSEDFELIGYENQGGIGKIEVAV
ncbi:thymidylate synthase [Lederbergia lenta]|uniref:thymidylate synthase n=1 Tax=Lederbergia lenta TaxID=1467 RepID=UPI00203B3803|nr:thymidylate synthase [Lederbergia lenta]MCM3109861.1 thymidylate synthase [Lederbergia lenta]